MKRCYTAHKPPRYISPPPPFPPYKQRPGLIAAILLYFGAPLASHRVYFVRPILLYGSETWKTTKSLQSKLQAFVNKCLRYILKIWWPNKITNEELWRKTNQEDITSTIRRRKWNWIDHTLRKDSATNITRQALDYNPQGKRKRGRPKKNRRRSTLKDLETVGMTWQEAKVMAQKRVRWRAMVDALCSQGGDED